VTARCTLMVCRLSFRAYVTMRRQAFYWTAAGTLLAALVACSDSLYDGDCTLEARSGLIVTVRDSVTGALVPNASVVARNATITDTARDVSTGVYSLAYEMAGVFEVVVERTGYRPWSRANVRIRQGRCHVETVSLTALLQPQP
jgi:hypothetical protein